jgi:hypothetical protein
MKLHHAIVSKAQQVSRIAVRTAIMLIWRVAVLIVISKFGSVQVRGFFLRTLNLNSGSVQLLC